MNDLISVLKKLLDIMLLTMSFAIVHNKKIIDFVYTDDDFLEYVIDQNHEAAYIEDTSVDDLRKHDFFKDGKYLLSNDIENSLTLVEKRTITDKGFFYNSQHIEINELDKWEMYENLSMDRICVHQNYQSLVSLPKSLTSACTLDITELINQYISSGVDETNIVFIMDPEKYNHIMDTFPKATKYYSYHSSIVANLLKSQYSKIIKTGSLKESPHSLLVVDEITSQKTPYLYQRFQDNPGRYNVSIVSCNSPH